MPAAKSPGAALEKGQIEAVQVVILDHVGIGLANDGHQLADERRFARVVRRRRFEQPRLARRETHGHEKDAIACRIEAGRLEVELQAAKTVE